MMGNVSTIGLDIAKSVFQAHGVDAAGEIVARRKLTRGRVLAFFEKLPMSRRDGAALITQDRASDEHTLTA